MPLTNLLTVSLTLDVLRAGRTGFGIPMIAVEVATSIVPNRTLVVSQRQELLDAGALATDPVVRAFDALVGQTRRPTSVVIGRRVPEVAQVIQVDIASSGDGDYVVTLNGVPFTFAASANNETEIRDGLIALITADAAYAAAIVDTDSFTITAAQAGLSFTIALDSPATALSSSTTTPNTGIAEDLAAIRAENSTWYGYISAAHTDHAIREASAWSQANGSTDPTLFLAQSNSADVIDAADTDDVFSELSGLGRFRTIPCYKAADTEYGDAAELGKMLPTEPGSANWSWQTLLEVTGDDLSVANVSALQAKRVNWIETIGSGPTFYEGFCCGGYYAEQIRAADKLSDEINASLVDLFQTNDVVDFEEEGIDQVDDAIETAARRQAFVIPSSIVVSGAEAADIPDANLASRTLPARTLSARIRTPINRAAVNGTLTL